nr:lipopolysaccharide biosynthesis protein [uncultured Dethiosulfovibrio sp.]
MGRRGVSALVTIFLGRFLAPSDFGLIAMASVFFAFANAVMEAGFSQALIRKKEIFQIDYSTIFFTNIILGAIAYISLFSGARFIAQFYSEPRLILLIRVIGLVVVINSFQIIQIVDLTRRLDFKTQFQVTVPSSFLSGLIAVAMAVSGYGVWSLVAQMILASLITTVSLWRVNLRRPKFEFETSSFLILFGFGSKLFLSGIINLIFQSIYLMVIGRLFSPTVTGYYFFAMKMRDMILEQFLGTIQRVIYPTFSLIQDNDIKLKNGYRKVMQSTGYVIFPLMIFVIVTARPLFAISLNARWNPAIPYMQLLCLAGIMYPLHVINLNILQVKGRSDLFLYLEIIKSIISLTVLLISARYGIMSILIGRIITSILAYLPNSLFSFKLIKYSIKEQLSDILPILGVALFAGTAGHLVETWLMNTAGPFLIFLIQCVVFVGVYFILSWLINLRIQSMLLEIGKRFFEEMIYNGNNPS